MKNCIYAAFMLLCVNLSTAQDDSFKKDAAKVIELSGGSAQLKMIKTQILTNIPADKQAMFSLEFDGHLAKILDKIAILYTEVYTHQDIKDMLKFYESPIGLKIQKNTPILFEKTQALGAEWGQELQPMLIKYMQ